MKNICDCQSCRIVNILTEKETVFIKELFNSIGKKGPEGRIIAQVKHSGHNCDFKFSFGFDYYCDNPDLKKSHDTGF